MKVVVVDYGLGNLHSVVKALRHEGADDVVVSPDPSVVASADRLVLPGVGAFGDGMAGLARRGLCDAIHGFVRTGRPLLGICLGMQLLMTESDEFGLHEGLGLISGRVRALTNDPGTRAIKVPHIGWNGLDVPRAGRDWRGTVLEALTPGTMVYFVHSFTAHPTDEADRLADTDYGGQRVAAAIQRDQVIGCQFHPEKSGPAGLRILRRFLT